MIVLMNIGAAVLATSTAFAALQAAPSGPPATPPAVTTTQVAVVPRTVLMIDASASLAARAGEVRQAARRVAAAVPPRGVLAISRFTSEVAPLFEGDPRVEPGRAESTIDAIRFDGKSTDIGGALAAAAGTGPAIVVLLTDGDPRPGRRSPFAGRALDALLQDERLVGRGPERHFVVRLFGRTRVVPSLPNVVATDGDEELGRLVAAFHESRARAATALSARERAKPDGAEPPDGGSTFGSFAIVALLGLVLAAGAVVMIARRRAADRAAMLASALDEPEPLAETPPEGQRFRVSALDEGGFEASVDLGPGAASVTLGERADAGLHLPEAGAEARLTLQPPGRGRSRLELENIRGEVAIGRYPVAPGASVTLPDAGYLELRVGAAVVSVCQVTEDSEEEDRLYARQ
jgi:hypothetical protein